MHGHKHTHPDVDLTDDTTGPLTHDHTHREGHHEPLSDTEEARLAFDESLKTEEEIEPAANKEPRLTRRGHIIKAVIWARAEQAGQGRARGANFHTIVYRIREMVSSASGSEILSALERLDHQEYVETLDQLVFDYVDMVDREIDRSRL